MSDSESVAESADESFTHSVIDLSDWVSELTFLSACWL